MTSEEECAPLTLQGSDVKKLVSRLYAPDTLLNKTVEEKERKARESRKQFSLENDPHLRNYWSRKKLLSRQARRNNNSIVKRLPPLDYRSKDSTISTPSPCTSRAESHVSAKGDSTVLRKKDLTAISILVNPPVHFQAMVHRLHMDPSSYDLKWMLATLPEHANGLPLLTLDDVPTAVGDIEVWQQKQKAYLKYKYGASEKQRRIEPNTPGEKSPKSEAPKNRDMPGRVLITSPRSALCCLKAGIEPASLMPKNLQHFQKEVDLEGAPVHAAKRRYQHFETDRQGQLNQLREAYHRVCSCVSMKQFVHLVQRFNPETNYDSALQDDLKDISSIPVVEHDVENHAGPASPTEGDSYNYVQIFRDIDTDDKKYLTQDEIRKADLSVNAKDLFCKMEGDISLQQFLQVMHGGQQGSNLRTCETISKEERLRDKCKMTLDKAKQKLQGHLVRNILLKRKTKKEWEDRQDKMTERLQRYAEEKDRAGKARKDMARKKAENCREVLMESRALAESRRMELIKRQEDADDRRNEVIQQRKYLREVSREDAKLRVKSKLDGIARQRNVDEWSKLCILDRIRRRHDKANYTETCLSNVLNETKYAREEMLRENEMMLKVLQTED